MTGAPTLDEIGISGDVQKILEDAAKDVITEPTERWSKQSSRVRMGKRELPERVTVYRRLTGRAVELPTATISQSMQKTAPDGGPVFVRTSQECATQPPAFIDLQCEVCREASGKAKRFYKESNYRGHMRGFHELEWEEIREQQERDRSDRQYEAMMALAQRGIVPQEEVQNARQFKCEECGREFTAKIALFNHQKIHVS